MNRYIMPMQEETSSLIPIIILVDRKLREKPLDARALEDIERTLTTMYDSSGLDETDMDTCKCLINLIHKEMSL